MRSIALALVLLIAPSLIAQEQQQVNDSSKPYFTIITHADWAKRPLEKELVDAVTSQPTLGISRQCHFNHYTVDSDMYKHRWSTIYPESSLPAVVFQNPGGGYWYKASGQNVPRGSNNLFGEIEKYAKLVPQEMQPKPQEADERPKILPWRRPDRQPDNNPDQGFTPDSDWAGIKTPIRDTLSSAAMLMIGVVLIAFLLAIAVLGIGLILVINKVFK